MRKSYIFTSYRMFFLYIFYKNIKSMQKQSKKVTKYGIIFEQSMNKVGELYTLLYSALFLQILNIENSSLDGMVRLSPEGVTVGL